MLPARCDTLRVVKPLSIHTTRSPRAAHTAFSREESLPSPDGSSEPTESFTSRKNRPEPGIWKRIGQKLFPFTKPKERQWTVLYYGAGNNNLSRDLNMEMGGLRNAGSSHEVQVVAQLAREDQDVIRGEMAKIPVRFGAVRPEFVERESLSADMGKKETLSDFLAWGMQEYPAKHYMVIQAGHGNGHRGSMTDESTGSIITPVEQRQAFESAPHKVDILLKESCMGASLEEAYEMKESVRFYLASQDVTQGSVDLHGFLQEARREARSAEYAPEKAMRDMTEHQAQNVKTFSAVDCSKLGQVGSAARELMSALNTREKVAATRQIAAQTPRVAVDGERLTSSDELVSTMEEKRLQYRDSVGFAQRLSEQVDALRPQADNVVGALQQAIVYQYGDPEHSDQTGLSWNLSPDPGVTAGAAYEKLAFAKDTGWTGVVVGAPGHSSASPLQ